MPILEVKNLYILCTRTKKNAVVGQKAVYCNRKTAARPVFKGGTNAYSSNRY